MPAVIPRESSVVDDRSGETACVRRALDHTPIPDTKIGKLSSTTDSAGASANDKDRRRRHARSIWGSLRVAKPDAPPAGSRPATIRTTSIKHVAKVAYGVLTEPRFALSVRFPRRA